MIYFTADQLSLILWCSTPILIIIITVVFREAIKNTQFRHSYKTAFKAVEHYIDIEREDDEKIKIRTRKLEITDSELKTELFRLKAQNTELVERIVTLEKRKK